VSIPYRGQTGHSTYFVTANCADRKYIFRGKFAPLFIEVLYHYRARSKYLLHEFVVMPDHFHLLMTPIDGTTLERAVQLIKGGFSYRARLDQPLIGNVWQTSFYDRRIRNWGEYCEFRDYIFQNPSKRKLCDDVRDWQHSSIQEKFATDPVPQRLKP
jgi:putative transposase